MRGGITNELRIARYNNPYRGTSLEGYVRSHLHVSRGHVRYSDFWMKEEVFVTAYASGKGLSTLLYERVEFHLPFHKGVKCGITFEWPLGPIGG